MGAVAFGAKAAAGRVVSGFTPDMAGLPAWPRGFTYPAVKSLAKTAAFRLAPLAHAILSAGDCDPMLPESAIVADVRKPYAREDGRSLPRRIQI